GPPAPGSVEVDDVQSPGTLRDPALGRVERIGVVDRLLLEGTPRKAHRLALEDVDRGQEDHAAAGCAAASLQTATKLASIRRPCAEDFSGWNWTPKTMACSTIVAYRSPYSVVPTTSAGRPGRTASECPG